MDVVKEILPYIVGVVLFVSVMIPLIALGIDTRRELKRLSKLHKGEADQL